MCDSFHIIKSNSRKRELSIVPVCLLLHWVIWKLPSMDRYDREILPVTQKADSIYWSKGSNNRPFSLLNCNFVCKFVSQVCIDSTCSPVIHAKCRKVSIDYSLESFISYSLIIFYIHRFVAWLKANLVTKIQIVLVLRLILFRFD